MNWNKPHRIMRDESGDHGGGGGGPAPAPSAAPAAAPTPAPQSAPASTPNPSPPASFRYDTDKPSTPEHAARVGQILDKEKNPEHRLSFDDIRDILGFSAPLTKNAPAEEEGEPKGEAVDPNAPDPNAAPNAPETPKLDPNVAALVEALSKTVTPAPAPESKPAPGDGKPKPYYGGTVPALEVSSELANVIFNAENPQQAHAALNYMVNGIMNRIMDDTGARMLQVAKTLMANFPKIAEHTVERRSTDDKFYAKFAELNRPAFQPVVAQVAQAMIQSGRSPSDPKFLDDLGDTVHKFLEQEMGQSFRPQKKIAPAPTPGAPKATKPPAANRFHTPGGTRLEASLPNGKDDNDWRKLVI